MKTLHFFRRIGFCLLCVTFSLSADTLYLKDGRKLEGKILSKGKIYVIQLKYGKLKVKESEILKIEEQAEETQKPPENPSSSSENPPPSDFIPLKPKQIQTYTTDERIEKVVNAYSTNLLEKLFRLESHLEAALLLKESGDPRLIPLIFQKMEELQIRDVRLSLFFSHRSAYHRLIAGIGELPEEQQIPYEELFTKGMKSSNPFVQILSLYGLKERKAFQYSHASSLLEYYDYESLYTYNIGGSDAHFQARSEILSFLFPYAKEILEVDPSLVEKNVAKIVYASAGLSPEIQQNTAVFLLKTWDIPQVGELVVEEFRKSLSFSERPKYYNEDPQGKAVVLNRYEDGAFFYYLLVTQLSEPGKWLEKLYPLVRLTYAQISSPEVSNSRKNLFCELCLYYARYAKEEAFFHDWIRYFKDHSQTLSNPFLYRQNTLESKILDFFMIYVSKKPESIPPFFVPLLEIPYLEHDILNRATLLAKKYSRFFEGSEEILKQTALRTHLNLELKKQAISLLFRIHNEKAKEALLHLAETPDPNVSIVATSLLKKW